MLILGADTSCDDTAFALLNNSEILSSVVYSHALLMEKYGGIVPEIASREHIKAVSLAFKDALGDFNLKSIDRFAVTNRPGLIGSLLIGLSFIKSLAFATKKPFSVIDHIEAHLYSPLLDSKVPEFPWIGLVVSGGHTELFKVEGLYSHNWLGGTLDDAAGEAFDKIGKLLGFPYPAGPKMDKFVYDNASSKDRKKYRFPRPIKDDFNFSFSGLKTAVLREVEKLKIITESEKLSLSASAEEAIVETLVHKAVNAAKHFGIKNIVITGGVACNRRLRELLPEAYYPKLEFCTDNAAMVANLAFIQNKSGKLKDASYTETVYCYSEKLTNASI